MIVVRSAGYGHTAVSRRYRQAGEVICVILVFQGRGVHDHWDALSQESDKPWESGAPREISE